jgi:hypothetical protein
MNEYPIKTEMVKTEMPEQSMTDHQSFDVTITHCGEKVTKRIPIQETVGAIRQQVVSWLHPENPDALPTPDHLTRYEQSLDDRYRLIDIIPLHETSDVRLEGLFRITVTNADFVGKTVPVDAYNDMTFDKIRSLANEKLGEAYTIDADAEYDNKSINATTVAYAFTIYDADTFSMRSRPFDVKIRFNSVMNSVTVHKNMTLQQLHDQIANQYNLNTDFYMEIVNGARLPIDETPLHRMNITMRTVLSVQLMSGEFTQRIRYLCQNCGKDVSIDYVYISLCVMCRCSSLVV